MLDRTVSFLAKDLAPSARGIDQARRIPRTILQTLTDIGVFRLAVPTAQGGLGEGSQTSAMIIEALSTACASTAALVSLQHNFIVASLCGFGSDLQRSTWLPRLANGEALGCWALSEPDAGDDLSAHVTTATIEGDAFVIRGAKSFVTLGGEAAFAIVFAKGSGNKDLTAFLVPTDLPGVVVGPVYETLGLRGLPVVTLTLNAVRIPKANRLGEEGQGAMIIAQAMDGARIGVAAIATGITRAALDLSTQHALRTLSEGAPLASRQEVQFKLAEMSTEGDAARMLYWQASSLRDSGMATLAESAMAKAIAVEAAGKAASHALQILGSKGLLPEASVERLIRDAKNLEICVGTPESLRLAIASAILKD